MADGEARPAVDRVAMFKPVGLESRGEAVWEELAHGLAGDTGRLLLLAEACRMADTLDRLDEMISADSTVWAQITEDHGDGELVLRIDSALQERRSTLSVLRLTIRQLESEESSSEGGGLLDALALARAERLAEAADS